MTPSDVAWESRWKAVRPTAEYHATYGLEGAWRAQADSWGYPLEDTEQQVDVDGQTLPGRTFSTVGLVVWAPDGERVIGWPT